MRVELLHPVRPPLAVLAGIDRTVGIDGHIGDPDKLPRPHPVRTPAPDDLPLGRVDEHLAVVRVGDVHLAVRGNAQAARVTVRYGERVPGAQILPVRREPLDAVAPVHDQHRPIPHEINRAGHGELPLAPPRLAEDQDRLDHSGGAGGAAGDQEERQKGGKETAKVAKRRNPAF